MGGNASMIEGGQEPPTRGAHARLPDVSSVLGRHGIESAADGYPFPVLTAAIAARGWEYRVEELGPGRPGRRNYRHTALVFARDGGADRTYRFASSIAGRGRGATEEEALAVALARMLTKNA